MVPVTAEEREELNALLVYLFPDDLERVREAFGCTAFADSAILTSYPDRQSVLGFLPPSACGSSTLLFRGSRDGWKTKTFHEKCAGPSPTLVLLQTEDGYVFGGFTTHPWTGRFRSAAELTEADETFVFSLLNPAGHAPFKMPFTPTLLDAKAAAACNPINGDTGFGPAFGLFKSHAAIDVGGPPTKDLRSAQSCLVPTRCGFQPPADIPEDQLKTFLAGKEKFPLKEMEVYVLKGAEDVKEEKPVAVSGESKSGGTS